MICHEIPKGDHCGNNERSLPVENFGGTVILINVMHLLNFIVKYADLPIVLNASAELHCKIGIF